MSRFPASERSLPAFVDTQSRQSPGRVALEEKRRGIWSGWTWRQFACAVDGFAATLHARGFASGDRLVVMGEASIAWLVADLAAQRLGGASVTPSPDMAADDLARCLPALSPRFAAVDGVDAASRVSAATGLDRNGFFLLRPEAGAPGASVLESLEADVSTLPALTPDPRAVATFVFGRDGAGVCKPVALTHERLLHKAAAVLDATPRQDRMDALLQLSLADPAERIVALVALSAGGKLSFPERVDTVGADLAEARPRLLSALPWQWRELRQSLDKRLAGSPSPVLSVWKKHIAGEGGVAGAVLASVLRRRLGLGPVRLALSHGAPLHAEDIAFLRALGLEVLEGYGVEATSGWSLLRLDGGPWLAVGDAKVATGDDRVRVIHDEGEVWPAVDLEGELGGERRAVPA